MNIYILIFTIIFTNKVLAQFAPVADSANTTAIYYESSKIKYWAQNISVNRGWQDQRDTTLGRVSNGTVQSAKGKADNKTISLGEGGIAIINLDVPLLNSSGPDFAVFENAFDNEFLELAFVEVSENGIDYVRFPNESLTDTTTQVGSFGVIDATKINNLAGKYRVFYGTPFDLDDLIDQNINLNNINFIKIIDITGNIAKPVRDSKNRIINDPWATPYFSCGFDLDAVAIINSNPLSIDYEIVDKITISPNPFENIINVNSKELIEEIEIMSIEGKKIYGNEKISSNIIDLQFLNNGRYLMKIKTPKTTKIVSIIKI